MQTLKSRSGFFDTEEGKDIKQTLEYMMSNGLYNTEASYTPDVVQYPDHLIPFADKHIKYLNSHPALDPQMYVANLKLMTRNK